MPGGEREEKPVSEVRETVSAMEQRFPEQSMEGNGCGGCVC